MNDEKTTSIFRTERDKEEFLRLFREKTMSGAVSEDVAVEKLIRDNPRLFYQPTADELKKIAHSEMNAAMRAGALRTNKFTDSFFTKGKE